jgi:hypothetical protein
MKCLFYDPTQAIYLSSMLSTPNFHLTDIKLSLDIHSIFVNFDYTLNITFRELYLLLIAPAVSHLINHLQTLKNSFLFHFFSPFFGLALEGLSPW